jgi:hypothetical protein
MDMVILWIGVNMKRIIEVSASYSGKISTGQFENENPFFSAKETIEVDETTEVANTLIDLRQSELKEICYTQFKRHAEIAYQEKVAKSYANIRFYDAGNGQKYPSVTSIINMDENFFMPADELAQYGARGTVIHKQIELFLKDGVWREPKDIPEVAFQVMTVIKGTLGLQLDDVNFTNWYKDYPIKVLEQEKTVINHEHKYAGRLDILCVIDSKNPGKWDKIEGIQYDTPTILDVKTSATLDHLKGFTQQGAYAMTDPAVKQIGLIHLTKENVCGYAKPKLSNKIEHYWSIFLNKRAKFTERYGV